jgi:hypothetical protein
LSSKYMNLELCDACHTKLNAICHLADSVIFNEEEPGHVLNSFMYAFLDFKDILTN